MNEGIFGSLSTVEKRIAYWQAQRQGVQHRYRLEPRAPGPDDRPVLTVTTELPQTVSRIECLLLEPEPAVIPLDPVKIDWNVIDWRYCQTWQGTLPACQAGSLVRYRIAAYVLGSDEPVWADSGETFAYLVGAATEPPTWAAEAIIYQIFPDRFHPGSGRTWNPVTRLSDIYGGTLRGIIEHLDYIADLGFNCIWLNPFFPDHTHHGYHATDYFAVNPRLGSLDDVRELVDKAHARGIRLLLDFVANHVGSQHQAFQTALADPESDTYHWFYWGDDWPHGYKTYFNVRDLPQLNVANPAVRDYLFRSACYWLGEIGFDGLRLDYVLGPSHDFWTELRAVVEQVKPDAWLFGEAVATPQVQLSYEGRFHGCLDFLLAQALRRVFGFGTMDVAAFDNFLNQHEAYFPTTFSRPSFLDNHDMDRFLWLTRGDKRKLKLAALCHFTLIGPPIVYNGTEVGVTQERAIHAPDSHGMEECRQPMLWDEAQDRDLHAFYEWLIRFRREHPVLWRGSRQTVHVDAAAGTYAYVRQDEQETILVAFNLSDVVRPLTVHLPKLNQTAMLTLSPWEGEAHVYKHG